MTRSAIRRSLFVILLFLLAFFPRALQPVSRPLVWYLRSAHFIEAVLAGDWANTVYSEHPGVALMWPAGIGLKLYWTLSGVTPAAHTVPPDFEPIHFFGPVDVAEIAAALTPLALLIALGIVGVYLMLRRLFDEPTATVAGLLLALSPYYLAQSKILHLDALLATLMLLSTLALLLYRRDRRTRWLLLSGALGGLALLVKTPALFLLPFTALVLLIDTLHNPSVPLRLRPSAPLPLRPSAHLLLWLLVAMLAYFSLWPVMWVEPGRGLAAVKWGLTRHATTAHDTPTFFLGQMLREDPGPLFYAVTLLFRTGEVELAFLAVAAVLGVTHLLRRRRLSQAGLDYLLLLAYAVFFLAGMCLGAKKMPRYVLPALLALDVLAAAGIVAWARGLARLLPSRPPSVPLPPLSPPPSWGGREREGLPSPRVGGGAGAASRRGRRHYGSGGAALALARFLPSRPPSVPPPPLSPPPSWGGREREGLPSPRVGGGAGAASRRGRRHYGGRSAALWLARFLPSRPPSVPPPPLSPPPSWGGREREGFPSPKVGGGARAASRRGRRHYGGGGAALALMALPLLIQAALILPRHPYYGTALNWLAGGPPAAARSILIGEEGEGLAELSATLNARPGADQFTVAAQLKHVFNQTFRGTTVEIDQPADYVVFHRNYTARDYKIQHWGELWERYAARTPEREVRFDGVPYAWLYPALEPDTRPEHLLPVNLGDHFRFLGYDLRGADFPVCHPDRLESLLYASPGDRVPLTLYWQATEPVTDDFSIFVHLLDPTGKLTWQDDGPAAHGARPTWSWLSGEVIADPHTVALPADLPEGDYSLATGLYDWRTGERLRQDQVTVATLAVRRPRTQPLAWLARGLASLAIALKLPWLSKRYGGAIINQASREARDDNGYSRTEETEDAGDVAGSGRAETARDPAACAGDWGKTARSVGAGADAGRAQGRRADSRSDAA